MTGKIRRIETDPSPMALPHIHATRCRDVFDAIITDNVKAELTFS
jgi:hypothetical protein